jgi:hypothetical protein
VDMRERAQRKIGNGEKMLVWTEIQRIGLNFDFDEGKIDVVQVSIRERRNR